MCITYYYVGRGGGIIRGNNTYNSSLNLNLILISESEISKKEKTIIRKFGKDLIQVRFYNTVH
jgi:hypothetical protein